MINSNILYAKKERVDKQYYVDFNITKEDAIQTIKIAEEFCKEMYDFISKLSNESSERYISKLKEIVQ